MDRYNESQNIQENRDKLFLWLAKEYSQYYQRKSLPVEEFVVVTEEPTPPPASTWCVIV